MLNVVVELNDFALSVVPAPEPVHTLLPLRETDVLNGGAKSTREHSYVANPAIALRILGAVLKSDRIEAVLITDGDNGTIDVCVGGPLLVLVNNPRGLPDKRFLGVLVELLDTLRNIGGVDGHCFS